MPYKLTVIGLRGRSAAARVVGLRVRIPPEAQMTGSCEYCAGSGRGNFVGLIPHPEESYRVWCVCDLETSTTSQPRHRIGAVSPQEKED
jgi:hypothetical protein